MKPFVIALSVVAVSFLANPEIHTGEGNDASPEWNPSGQARFFPLGYGLDTQGTGPPGCHGCHLPLILYTVCISVRLQTNSIKG